MENSRMLFRTQVPGVGLHSNLPKYFPLYCFYNSQGGQQRKN